jgi:TM2 domain-containing membrane protein YozV
METNENSTQHPNSKDFSFTEESLQSGTTSKQTGRNKVTAGLIAIFFGGIGAHRFYLGQWRGLIYLLFFWSYIPGIIGLIEGIVFLCTSDEKWNAKYGEKTGPSIKLSVVILLLIVALIGMIAFIAVPAYQTYLQRAAQLH